MINAFGRNWNVLEQKIDKPELHNLLYLCRNTDYFLSLAHQSVDPQSMFYLKESIGFLPSIKFRLLEFIFLNKGDVSGDPRKKKAYKDFVEKINLLVDSLNVSQLQLIQRVPYGGHVPRELQETSYPQFKTELFNLLNSFIHLAYLLIEKNERVFQWLELFNDTVGYSPFLSERLIHLKRAQVDLAGAVWNKKEQFLRYKLLKEGRREEEPMLTQPTGIQEITPTEEEVSVVDVTATPEALEAKLKEDEEKRKSLEAKDRYDILVRNNVIGIGNSKAISEISRLFGKSPRHTTDLLEDLKKRGMVLSKKDGRRKLFWVIP